MFSIRYDTVKIHQRYISKPQSLLFSNHDPDIHTDCTAALGYYIYISMYTWFVSGCSERHVQGMGGTSKADYYEHYALRHLLVCPHL